MHPDDRHDDFGYKNEFQAAYELSCLTTPRNDDRAKIEELAALGRYVVYTTHEHCCQFTDAIIYVGWYMMGDFATLDEANAFIAEQDLRTHDVNILGPEPVRPYCTPTSSTTTDANEIPF